MNRIADGSIGEIGPQEINHWTGKPCSESYKKLRAHREQLPVYQFRDQLIESVRNNRVTIIEGATGSGKTTQIPQFLLEANIIPADKQIVCTQPRRVAALNVANRVAKEMDVPIGQVVAYTIRFDSTETENTSLVYMTDGLLLREFVRDPDVNRYGIIIIDEAHERTINTDIIIGLLKKAVERRNDLHAVIMSATLEVDKFIKFFPDSPHLKVPGRLFKVDIIYSKEPVGSYVDAAVTTVYDIHVNQPPGDILLFLTGEEEIDLSCGRIRDKINAQRALLEHSGQVLEPIVLPFYASLHPSQQEEVFKPTPPGARKIIISTNIAETSVTIDGVVFVVDPGFVKQKQYDPERHMSRLIVTVISKAAANQRSGRAGRTQEGKCYRLYPEAAYNMNLPEQTTPEIQRTDLANVLLMMLAAQIKDVVNFPFLDPPPAIQMGSAAEELYHLGIITMEGELTEIGKNIALIPVEPKLAKALICSEKYGCTEEIATLVAVLSEQGQMFSRPQKDAAKADEKHATFKSKSGDHVTYLNVFEDFLRQNPKQRRIWCETNFINFRFMERANRSRQQLVSMLKHMNIKLMHIPEEKSGERDNLVIRALLEGMFMQIAMLNVRSSTYQFLQSAKEAEIYPSSMLKNATSEWIVYSEYISTKAEFVRTVSIVKPEWCFEASPSFFDLEQFDNSSIKQRLLTKRKEYLKMKEDSGKFKSSY